MKADRSSLKEACFNTARAVLWAQRPVSLSEIEALADRFYNDALLHEEFVIGQGRDANLIGAAVVYLGNRHAIPPMANDPHWFNNMLDALIELCCPNQSAQLNEEPFFRELELGLAKARNDYAT